MPRQFDNLYPSIVAFDNLHRAWRGAARGKRNKTPVARFEMKLEDNLIRLQRELVDETWRPGEYHSFYILDPKRRLVSAAPFRDRIVHHALCNIIEPIFERVLIGDCYANRKGKGTHAALDRAQHFIRGYPYVLQCDIRQFFASVDHQILEQILFRKIVDNKSRHLIRRIISSGKDVLVNEYKMIYYQGDDLLAVNRARGLPIGNLTSQFWANVYLNELDQFVKRKLRCRAYLRYVDDFLLFSNSKKQLWEWKTAIRECLSGLRLALHEGYSTVYPVAAGVPFLGFRLYDDHRRLKRKNGVNFMRRQLRHYKAYQRGELTREELNFRIKGWAAHVAHGDTWGLRRSLLSRTLPIPMSTLAKTLDAISTDAS